MTKSVNSKLPVLAKLLQNSIKVSPIAYLSLLCSILLIIYNQDAVCPISTPQKSVTSSCNYIYIHICSYLTDKIS